MSRKWPELGIALRQLRLAKDLTQEKVIDGSSGVYSDARSLRRIEDGQRRPSRAALLRIITAGLAEGRLATINRILELADYEGLSQKEMEESRLEAAIPNSPASESRYLDFRLRTATVLANFRPAQGEQVSYQCERANGSDLDMIDAVSTAVFVVGRGTYAETPISITWRARMAERFQYYPSGFTVLRGMTSRTSFVGGYSIYFPLTARAWNDLRSQLRDHNELRRSDIVTEEEESRMVGLTYFIEAVAKLPWIPFEAGHMLIKGLKTSLREKQRPRQVATVTISETGAELAEAHSFRPIWEKKTASRFMYQCWLKEL